MGARGLKAIGKRPWRQKSCGSGGTRVEVATAERCSALKLARAGETDPGNRPAPPVEGADGPVKRRERKRRSPSRCFRTAGPLETAATTAAVLATGDACFADVP